MVVHQVSGGNTCGMAGTGRLTAAFGVAGPIVAGSGSTAVSSAGSRAADVEFRILGSVQVLYRDRPLPLPAGRGRALLAVLLLRANQVVTVRELADCLWEGPRPVHQRAAVQTHVGRLRRALGEESIGRLVHTTSTGYVIHVEPDQLDLTRFRRLTEDAGQVADRAEQVVLLERALALWRDEPLADVRLLRDAFPQLVEERLHAVERLMDARMRLGQHAQVVAQLTSLSREHPLRERFWAQLMLALYRCDRQADALQAYQTISRRLADELGLDPGDELRELHRSILCRSVALG